MYVPEEESLRQELISRHHDDRLAGHFGVEKTLELLKRKFYWGSIAKDVKGYISTCDICQRVRVTRHRPYGEMQALPLPAGPWQEITMDFIVKLPPSKRGDSVSDSILVIVDRYTKMAKYFAVLETITAPQLAELFFDKIVTQYGTLKGIVTDRGSVFTSAFWSEVCFYAHVKRRLSTAFHLQTDGQTERQNQTLEHYLRVFCSTEQDDWAKLLPMAEFAYNNSYHSTIKSTPFQVMHNYDPSINYEDDTGDGIIEGEVPAAAERVRSIQDARIALEKSWASAAESHAKFYNKSHIPQSYNVGDLVMLSTQNLKQKRPKRKLSHRFIGPFLVLDAIGKQAYRLALLKTLLIHPVFHVSLLEPYKRREGDMEVPALPQPELINDQPEWEVEKILDRRMKKGKLEYKVKWSGYLEEYNQWIPKLDMEGLETMRKQFDTDTPARGRGRPKKV